MLMSLQSSLDVEKAEAIAEMRPFGAKPISMATYELVDSAAGRKTHWRLYGVSGQAIKMGQFVFADRAVRERAFPQPENILCRDMVIYRWHEQYTQQIGVKIGEQGAMVCFACQFVNTDKAPTHGAMIPGCLEGPKMLLLYMLDTENVHLVPISAIAGEDVPAYEIGISPKVDQARDLAVTVFIKREVQVAGVLTKRIKQKEEFSPRKLSARAQLAAAKKASEKKEAEKPLSPLSAL